ncbi:MAG: ABC transporter ATP-binding protein [Armatimonadota bacterium]|nr:ABC transporter ATP-binding protein [Armatimonadota bacterium]MDR7460403.1 ABC transporter ATP-binding protein [Armatimonadota bacterium]MDR7479100.1 ABC transporter ATP-binding protein [Armatimonadota bacterium]MDR7488989.1 ABC transporter ATP-binding protein [Armatimonadota bacterium]MDR7491126.1 ABC transporter ATP-binding protein [Armatimonadota bacterium]
MLEVRDLTTGYGDLTVLRGVSLEVRPQTVTVLIGPNGAGKTTLLRAIVGLLRPRGSAPAVLWRGRRIDRLRPDEIVRLGIAVSPEGARVFPEMTVRDNLLVAAAVARARAQQAQRLREVFDLFPRLAERQGQLARTLSGGERQMLSLGRALMTAPELLTLDEPSLGLQPTLVRAIMETVRRIHAQGVTVLLIEQNVHASLPLAHQGYVMEHGRIVRSGTGAELLDDPHVRVSYLGL